MIFESTIILESVVTCLAKHLESTPIASSSAAVGGAVFLFWIRSHAVPGTSHRYLSPHRVRAQHTRCSSSLRR